MQSSYLAYLSVREKLGHAQFSDQVCITGIGSENATGSQRKSIKITELWKKFWRCCCTLYKIYINENYLRKIEHPNDVVCITSLLSLYLIYSIWSIQHEID